MVFSFLLQPARHWGQGWYFGIDGKCDLGRSHFLGGFGRGAGGVVIFHLHLFLLALALWGR